MPANQPTANSLQANALGEFAGTAYSGPLGIIKKIKMGRCTLFLILFLGAISSYGQIENKWQPDSVYTIKRVKKIYVYMNSKKDLSEIVEFGKSGKKLRSIKFSASHNWRTRKSKRIEKISLFKYDSLNRLSMIVDSVGNDSITFQYETNGRLNSSRKKLGGYIYETKYFYTPSKSTTTRKQNSKIVFEKTKEYENEFYVKRFFGYYFEPKLKKVKNDVNGIENTVAYSDYNDLTRYEDDKKIENQFDSEGKLTKSKIKSVFMNDRINEFELKYDYYKNGLLKSIRGYVPRHFKYEFYE